MNRYKIPAVTALAALAVLTGCGDATRDQRVNAAASHLCGTDAAAVRWHWQHFKDKTDDDPADAGESSLTAVGCNGDRRVGQVYRYDDDGYVQDDDARTDAIRRAVCPEYDSHRVVVEEVETDRPKQEPGDDWFWILRCAGAPR